MSRRLLLITEGEWLKRAHAARYCVGTLAKRCGVSTSTLGRHIRATTGQTPHDWVRKLRMARALELLTDGTSVKETAAELGYKSPYHFARDFRDNRGYPPSEHVRRVRHCMETRKMTDLDMQ